MSQGAAGFSDSRQSPYWRVWAPLLARGAAIGLALLGLAGIGLAAARSESPSLARASIGVGLAQLVGGGSGAPVSRAAGLALDPAPAPASAPPSAPTPIAAGPVPCTPSRRSAGAPAGPAAPATGEALPSAGARGLTAEGRVILNRAGAAELQRLPGIGAKRATAILALRQRLGRFRRASDLLRIKGVGPKLLERMLPRLVLDE
ncbi:MAG: hypothetical protein RL685_4736 [Pseudomonadota bacterium]